QMFFRIRRRDLAQHTDRDHVLRFLQADAHRDRAAVLIVVVTWIPGLAVFLRYFAGSELRIVDQRARRETAFQRRRIDEGLDRRTRLAPCLRDMVELVHREIEAADHRADRTVLAIDRY